MLVTLWLETTGYARKSFRRQQNLGTGNRCYFDSHLCHHACLEWCLKRFGPLLNEGEAKRVVNLHRTLYTGIGCHRQPSFVRVELFADVLEAFPADIVKQKNGCGTQ